MQRLSGTVSIILYTGAVFMAGMLVGQLYALYVLVYTGAVFMIGLWLGQRAERRWTQIPASAAAQAARDNRAELRDTSQEYAARAKGG
jgi:hypothetical protein